MKQHICREQNSIKTCSKNLDRKLTLKDIATDLLSKGLRISVTTLSLLFAHSLVTTACVAAEV